uniref:Uncharacterized protein n=1 Tax=Vitis vinifera TaxID=29760 RepID=F6I5U4_VITVI
MDINLSPINSLVQVNKLHKNKYFSLWIEKWQGANWRDEEMNGQTEPPHGLGKISEQKGILGPGPADLRFSEAF